MREWQVSERTVTTKTREDVDKRRHLCPASGVYTEPAPKRTSWRFLTTLETLTWWTNNPSPGDFPKGNRSNYQKRSVYACVHRSTICNIQNLEVSQMSNDRWIDKNKSVISTQWNIIQLSAATRYSLLLWCLRGNQISEISWGLVWHIPNDLTQVRD